jgi:subtilisin family serine protease
MRNIITLLALLTILIPLGFGGTFDASTASAQDDNNHTEISGLLKLQVEAKLRSIDAELMEEGRSDILQGMNAADAEVINLNQQRIFIHLVDELNQSQTKELEDMGLTLYQDSWIPPVGNHSTGFIIANMPLDKLNKLASKNYIVRLDTAEQFLKPNNDLAAQKTKANDVWSSNYTGVNVTIAVLDSGLDITHNDIPIPLASKDYSNYPLLDDDIANRVIGHGTHVTGSALGKGTQSSGIYQGMASDANLVFLKIGNDTTGNAKPEATVNAIKAAIDTYNADIITISYGRWDSYHDGTSQEAQAVDYAVSQGAVVFISAGNSADDNEHYSGNVSGNSTSDYIQINVTDAGADNTALYFNLVWYDGLGTSNDLELEYYSDNYTLLQSTNSTQSESTRGTESVYTLYNNYVPTGNSTYFLRVRNNSGNSQPFHIYYSTEYNQSGAGSVMFGSPDPNYTISTPADADSAIAVGAYTTRKYWWNYANTRHSHDSNETVDQISSFSSRGPRVDSGSPPKPNIIAPGSSVISCRDNDIYPWIDRDLFYIDNDGPNADDNTRNNGSGPADYYAMQGTSMACPIAAGIAALLLEKHPVWTETQVRLAIESTATDKGAIGHDNVYGWGFINALAASNADVIPPTMELIIEAEEQYYSEAPVLSNFGFDDDVNLNDGWYQMDSYNGTWITLFTDVAGASWDSDNWTIPGFGALSEGSHVV